MLCGYTKEEDVASVPGSGDQSQEVSRVWKPSSAGSASIFRLFFFTWLGRARACKMHLLVEMI